MNLTDVQIGHIIAGLLVLFAAVLPTPKNEGFGIGIFGKAVLPWSFVNGFCYTLAILNFLYAFFP